MARKLTLTSRSLGTRVTSRPTTYDPNRKSFLDLPAEIRNRIYQLALTRNRPLTMCEEPDPKTLLDFKVRLNSTRIFPSILRSCRTINREATPVLYGDNTFTFTMGTALARFSRAIVREALKRVRFIDVTCISEPRNLSGLKHADGLVKLVIRGKVYGARLEFVAKGLRAARDKRKQEGLKPLVEILELPDSEAENVDEIRALLG